MPLASFSLEGRRRGNLRRSWRKTGEEGATFEVLAPGAACAADGRAEGGLRRMARRTTPATRRPSASAASIRPTSPSSRSRWCASTAASSPSPRLWTTARRAVVLDRPDALRRRCAEGHHGLPVRRADRLGRRPRATRRSTSAWRRWPAWRTGRWRRSCRGSAGCSSSAARTSTISRACAGTRTSTTRSGQPRYIAAARKWAIPILMADVGLLSSGGVAGLTRRGKRPSEERGAEQKRAA